MSTTYNNVRAPQTATFPTRPSTRTKAPSLWDVVRAVGSARSRQVMQELAEATAPSRPALAARLRKAAQDDWS